MRDLPPHIEGFLVGFITAIALVAAINLLSSVMWP